MHVNKLWSERARYDLETIRIIKGVVAGTGHRPPRLGLDYSAEHRRYLADFVAHHLEQLYPNLVLSGMAQGFDWALAEAAVELSIPFVAAVPFVGQESRWPRETRKQYASLLEKAEMVVTVCDGLHANAKYTARDEFMICGSDQILTLFDGVPAGGTHITLQFAKSQLVPAKNLWDHWVVPV